MQSGNGKEPLTGDEQAYLRRWERHMIGAFAISMTLLAVVLALWFVVRDWTPLVPVLLLAAAGSAVVQFSARCPRCRANLGLQTRLTLPHACKRCGVAFRD